MEIWQRFQHKEGRNRVLNREFSLCSEEKTLLWNPLFGGFCCVIDILGGKVAVKRRPIPSCSSPVWSIVRR